MPTQVAQACAEAAQGEVVSPANLNGAGQVVIAGARDAVARAGERAKALGARRVMPLPVSAPFHCALMKPAAGAPGAGAARARRRTTRACRSSPTSTPSRSATARGGDRGADRAGRRRRCAGRPWSAALRPRASQRMLRWVRARCLSGLVRKIHREATVLNFEKPGRSGRRRGAAGAGRPPRAPAES